MSKTIGVLALQGAFREHIKAIKQTGNYPVEVRDIEQLDILDGLIIPGGESTTISKLIVKYGFIDALKLFEKPIYGTCAGAILLAKKVPNLKEPILGLMNIEVERNSYGRQVDSFEAELVLQTTNELQRGQFLLGEDEGGSPLNKPFKGIFIRAPKITKIGKNIEVLAEYRGNPVLVKEGIYLAGTFHPELTDDYRIHRLFFDLCMKTKNEAPACRKAGETRHGI